MLGLASDPSQPRRKPGAELSVIDGEAVACGEDGVASFDRIRYRIRARVQDGARGDRVERAMSLRTRFKSNEKLQAETLDILTELIRRDLLTTSVSISDPDCVLSCNILDAYPTGSRSATMREVLNSYMTGVLPKRKGGPGITLTIDRRFRLLPKEKADISSRLAGLTRP